MIEDQELGNTLEIESSDRLLVALLPRMARIFTRDSSSKEPGIARIRDIAEAYLKTQARWRPMPDPARPHPVQIRETLAPEIERLVPHHKVTPDA
jgi:hypothetical protein